ncbi:hypothetical protein GR927_38475 [Mycolicibacterium sp. 3033]|nr:hypothetical protein [Mycolicibacterium aurantiacum]
MNRDQDDVEATDAESTGTEAAPIAGDDVESSADAEEGQTSPRRSRRTVLVAGLLAALLAGSAGLAGWLYLNQYRPDQQTDPSAQKVVLDAATTGTVALLSYSPDSLDKDFAAAKARLTGSFLSYYTQFTQEIVTPAAKQKSVKTSASVVRAAVSQMQPDEAEVLVFINQSTTSTENPDGAFAASSVRVGLTKVDGAWLIDAFDPV